MARPRKLPAIHQVYQKYNPKRVPRHRYDRVQFLLKNKKTPVHGRDDEYTTELYKFIKEWNRLGKSKRTPKLLHESRIESLFQDNPGLFYAYEAFLSGEESDNEDDDELRYVYEARILAGQSDQQIGSIIGVTPEMIEWYEVAFFNVRDRLNRRDYISKMVIGNTIREGFDNLTLELSAKYFAYFGGPMVLDMVLDGYNHGRLPPGPGDNISHYIDEHFKLGLRRGCGEAVNYLEINKWNVAQMFELHIRLIEASDRAEVKEGVKTPLEETLAAVLDVIPWSVGTAREEALQGSHIAPYLNHAAEPRAKDLMLISSGEAPYSPEDLAGRLLPPPKEREEE